MRKDFLDGIRGWAALMVVGSHFITNFAAHAATAYDQKFLRLPTDGTLAVYVFFVVSGFALSIGYIEKRQTAVLTSLALRRYARLTVPILASSLLALALWKTNLFFNKGAGELSNSEEWLGMFYSFDSSLGDALRFALFDVYVAYDGMHTYNPALWTMSIELAGSAVVLSALAVFGKIPRIPFYIAATVICCLIKTPLLAFIAGMGAAEIFHHHARTYEARLAWKFIAILLVAAGIACSYVGRSHYDDPRIVSLAAFAVVLGIASHKPLRHFFANRLSRLLGRISFPLYLTHLLVLCSFSSYIYTKALGAGLTQFPATTWTLILSLPVITLAAFAFEPIERLSISIGRRFAILLMMQPSPNASDDARPSYRPGAKAD